ncbi:MAG: hypothetical protein KC996_04405 [Phycisphaerales bacterium]|nr:hypothetical protein [Phycisphaerales bacterium]
MTAGCRNLGGVRVVCVCALSTLAVLPGCGERSTDASGRILNASVLGETGTHVGQFVYPRGMDLFLMDGRPMAVIVDKTARLQVLDLDSGSVVGAIKTPEWDQGMPTGLTVGPSLLDAQKQAVYVADTHEHRVLMYTLPLPFADEPGATEPAFAFGSFGREPGEFVYPTDIALRLNADGSVREIYVSEYGGNDRVSVFAVEHDDDGMGVRWERAIGVASETVDGSDDPRSLSRPQSIAIRRLADGSEELVLTDASHHRMGRFTLDGEPIAWIGSATDTDPRAMRFPYGLTLLDDSTALVTEFGGCVVRHLDLDSGETIERYGAPGRADGELATPWAAGVIDGKVVVLDSGNSRLQMFRASGITGEQHASSGGRP